MTQLTTANNSASSTMVHLNQFLFQHQQEHQLCPKLCLLIEQLALQCQQIGQRVRQGALGGVLGSLKRENIQGEEQQKLDLLANQMLLEHQQWHQGLAALASEEMDSIHLVPGQEQAPYLLLFDPLDGSSNIDVNTSIGTIFSVLNNPNAAEQANTPTQEKDFFQPGRQQVAAGYAIYGPQTMLVLTLGHGVYGFTLDPLYGQWFLTNEQIRIPTGHAEFAINLSNQRHWHPPVQKYIQDCLAGAEGPLQRDYNMRWIASMVADVHRILMRGGVFMYPADQRPSVQNGKLRLLYEANPMSLIIEQAGGAAIEGVNAILDVQPNALHQRISVILGDKAEVERIAAYHRQA